MDFKQVIIWGHTSRGHTHYWIHHAFNRAFKYLKYNTFWVDNKLSSLESIDRTIPSLFLTEGQVDKYIPLDNKNYYIIHNCKVEKYKNLNNVLSLQVYTSPVPSKPNISKYDKYMYYDLDRKKCWIPWATDLLPNEIQNIKDIDVIEDCAQSLGASIDNKKTGIIGKVGIFSFYTTKLMTSGGQGGMFVSKDKNLVDKVRDYREFDCRRDKKHRFNFQMTDLQASIGRVQLKQLPLFLERG